MTDEEKKIAVECLTRLVTKEIREMRLLRLECYTQHTGDTQLSYMADTALMNAELMMKWLKENK